MKLSRRNIKVIVIWVVGIGIGAVISVGLNRLVMRMYLAQEIDYTQAGTVNWFIAVPVFAVLVALIPAGFFIGRLVEQ